MMHHGYGAHIKRKHSQMSRNGHNVTSFGLYWSRETNCGQCQCEQLWNRWSTAAGPQGGSEASCILFTDFDAERRYAQIEKECLAAVWTSVKLSRFLTGLELYKLITDHKPLVPLINRKDLDQIRARCQRLLMRLIRLNPIAEHCPGKDMVIADALSRGPHNVCSEDDSDIRAHVSVIDSSWQIAPKRLELIRAATAHDIELQEVNKYVAHGWPIYFKDVTPRARPYFGDRASLTANDGLLVFENRIVIPSEMRSDILALIHDGHLGIAKCRDRAKQTVWWPGINKGIQKMSEGCSFCISQKTKQRSEPLQTTPLPDRPWQCVAANLCEHKNQQFLVVVDYYFRYLEIVHLPKTRSTDVTAKLKSIFARFGVPEVLVTDNGPQFSSLEFRCFSQIYDFTHFTSSPHFPQSNGEAEHAVQTAKCILKQDDPLLALMSYRAATSGTTGYSPAQLMMGRPIRTCLPSLPGNLMPAWPNPDEFRMTNNKTRKSYAKFYNNHYGAKLLHPLNPGD